MLVSYYYILLILVCILYHLRPWNCIFTPPPQDGSRWIIGVVLGYSYLILRLLHGVASELGRMVGPTYC